MAQTFGAGHVESAKDLPRPLQSGWNPGTWALPAATLSWASLAVLVVVFGFPQLFPTSRALFRLPVSPAILAVIAAVVAWGITLRCRNRPGRHLPRYWALGLAVLATAAAAVGFLPGDAGRSPWFHALSLALLTSSLTLTPRLLKLHPDRWLVQHVATLGLAAVLFLALPLSYVFGRQAVEAHKQRVAETIAELSREAGEVRAIYSSNESARWPQAEQQMQKLLDLPLEQWVPDRYLWEGAVVLGEEARLAAAYRELLDAVVAGLDPTATPQLWQPQFVWMQESRTWEQDAVFSSLSTAFARYHWRQGEILRLLEPPAGDSAALQDLATYYREKKEEAGEHLKNLSERWDQDWVPPLVEAREPGSDTAASPLAELLRRPLQEEGALRPVSLVDILNLPLREARELAGSAPGCGQKEYTENDFEYFRVDCFAYRARLDPKQPGADMRIEMRLVYKSETLEHLGRNDFPAELYFLFPVPAQTDASQYREDVVSAFKKAVAEEHGGATLIDMDRPPSKQFFFEDRSGRSLRAKVSTFTDLGGGVPGIQFRTFYPDRLR